MLPGWLKFVAKEVMSKDEPKVRERYRCQRKLKGLTWTSNETDGDISTTCFLTWGPTVQTISRSLPRQSVRYGGAPCRLAWKYNPHASTTITSNGTGTPDSHGSMYGNRLPMVDHVLHPMTTPWPEWVFHGRGKFPPEEEEICPGRSLSISDRVMRKSCGVGAAVAGLDDHIAWGNSPLGGTREISINQSSLSNLIRTKIAHLLSPHKR